jgi:hypothetical protein
MNPLPLVDQLEQPWEAMGEENGKAPHNTFVINFSKVRKYNSIETHKIDEFSYQINEKQK